MDKSDLKTANVAFSEGDVDKCLNQTNQILTDNPGNIEALLLQIKVFYKMQRWGDALNNINKILELENDNQLALNYKEMITNIISFWNKDYYNP
jgi:predicted Zn-dependent protease